ncbi:efflux RND transporter permease subunit [Xanthomonadaceae bacterium JHOS43]|nr:efflux RND transporter permease subunit [Xanthomonadaceae bacterium JHOS43]
MNIVETSLRRPVTVVMFFVSLLVIGAIASVRLPLEQFPEINAPFLAVSLPYAGSTPQEIERTLVRPVEEALATLPGIKRMRAQARADGGFIFLEFSDWDRDIAIAATEARDRIDAIRDELPDDFQRYFVQKFSTSDDPVLRMRLASETRDLTASYDLIDRGLKRRLERLPGVARVEISGAPPNEVEIALDPDRLTAHGVGLNELAGRLQAINFSVSGGSIDEAGRRLRVQPMGELSDLSQLRDLVLDARGLKLSDVADVRLQPARMDYRRQLEGRPAVGIDVYKERSANLVEISRAALAEVNRISEDPEFKGISFVLIDDQGRNVTESLLELTEAGIIGLLLAIAVLYFFLRHWPSTLMVTLAIPVCFIMTLGFMHFFGVTLNVLSMMGLLLAVGMLVDNAVVVVESIYQEREKHPGTPRLAAVIGTRHVAIALSAGTLCHCIVFVPNLFGETNQISIFMVQIAVTITVSLLASWLVAISLIPMLASRMKTPPAAMDEQGLIGRLRNRYAELLRWSLRHRGWSVLAILVIVLASMVPMGMMKTDMFQSSQGRTLNLYYQWRGAYTLEQMQQEIDKVESWIGERRDELQVEQIYSWFSEQGWGGTRLTLRSSGRGLRASEQVMDEIREGLPKSARATFGFQGDQGGNQSEGISMSLVGDSAEVLQELGDALVPLMAQRPELRDVRVETGDRNSELAIRVDRERAARYGFSAQEVATYVGIALRGTPLREFRRDSSEVPVQLRFADAQSTGIADLSGFTLRAASGEQIPLMALISVDLRPSATQVTRVDRQTMLELKADLAPGITAPEARKGMEAVMASASLPAGYRYTFEGAFRQNDEAGKQMMFNTLIALVMIYVVMAAVFESLLFPAAILSGIFFSILGVFWLFALTGTTFTIMASIGILVLMGVVVNNGIVMVEHINTLRRSGLSRNEALVQGCRDRLRPVLMTMGCAILGMVPISLSTTQIAGGGPPYYPMARAIAGGLAFSTVVTLLFLPTIYAILDDISLAMRRIVTRVRGAHPEDVLPAAQPPSS